MSRSSRLFKTKWLVIPTISVLTVAAAFLVVAQLSDDSETSSKSDIRATLDYQWSPEEQARREAAIAQKDSSLLPVCTDEYVAWRTATEEAREAGDGLMPPSPYFWSAPGCKTRTDSVAVSYLPDRFNYLHATTTSDFGQLE